MYDGREGKLELARADRSSNPQYGDVFYLYKKWRIKTHGERNGDSMFGRLEEVIKKYNTQYGPENGKAFLQRYEASIDGKSQKWEGKPGDTPLVLAICTPLMARAHVLLRQAGELVHCDSTASLDRCNCPTFIMSTACSAGAIPVGVVITSGEAEVTLKESFSYLRSIIMPHNAFFGRGTKGPQMFITDGCEAEKNALKAVWPESDQLLHIPLHAMLVEMVMGCQEWN